MRYAIAGYLPEDARIAAAAERYDQRESLFYGREVPCNGAGCCPLGMVLRALGQRYARRPSAGQIATALEPPS